MCVVTIAMFFVFCKQKTAYEMRISDWSSDVCSSDLSSQGLRCAARSILHRIEPDGGCACIFKRHPGRACSGTVAPQCQYSPERQGSAAVARREPYIYHPVQTLARTQGSRLDQDRDRPTLADDRAARRTKGGSPDRKSTRLNSSH